MRTSLRTPLIIKLVDPRKNILDPHEVARELKEIYDARDTKRLKIFRDAYVIGETIKASPYTRFEDITALVDENLTLAAGLADVVASCGYEARGQLLVKPRFDGPIATFYRESVREFL